MLRRLINGFWWAFTADGVASVLRDVGLLNEESLAGHLLPLYALIMSLPAALAIVVTPRAPKRVLLPMILFLWWGGPAGAFPLMLLDNFAGAGVWLSAAQLVLAFAINVSLRAPGAPWYAPFRENEAPSFQLKHLLIAGTAMACLGAFMAVLTLGSAAAVGLAKSSGGYVRLRPDGLYIVERRFKADDNEVRLVGMMHIADRSFYSDVLPKANPQRPTVVLLEGITDNKQLLKSNHLGYSRIARWFGIEAQENSEFTERAREGLEKKDELAEGALEFRHSDIDVESFQPRTLAFINAIMSLMNAEDFNQAWKMLSNPGSPLNDESASKIVMQDILQLRNQNLMKEIQSSMKNYRLVVVAWGAMHMPEIEAWLRKNKFKQSEQIERKALGFW